MRRPCQSVIKGSERTRASLAAGPSTFLNSKSGWLGLAADGAGVGSGSDLASSRRVDAAGFALGCTTQAGPLKSAATRSSAALMNEQRLKPTAHRMCERQAVPRLTTLEWLFM